MLEIVSKFTKLSFISWYGQQRKSEGVYTCDRPSNLPHQIQIVDFQALRPLILTDGIETQ